MIGLMPVRLDYAIKQKAILLNTLYTVFEQEAQKFNFVCAPGCKDCCTTNLLATSVEVRALLGQYEQHGQKQDLRALIPDPTKRIWLRPHITPNEMAALCLAGKEPPEETTDYRIEPCPFLQSNGWCSIYSYRPFMCRSFYSLRPCRDYGEALVPPEFFSLTTTFMQLLEEIDVAGLYGNFFDLLAYLLDREEALAKGQDLDVPPYLLSNREAPDFAIPPEHEEYVRSVLTRLYRYKIGETTFKALLDEVKQGVGVSEALGFLGEAL